MSKTAKLLRAKQVVEKLQEAGLDDLGLKWIDNQVTRGRLPFVVVGKYRRFREDLIDNMIEEWRRRAK